MKETEGETNVTALGTSSGRINTPKVKRGMGEQERSIDVRKSLIYKNDKVRRS